MTDLDNCAIIDDNPFGEVQEIVHDSECWRVHGACAIRKLEDINRLMQVCKKNIDSDIIRMIIRDS